MDPLAQAAEVLLRLSHNSLGVRGFTSHLGTGNHGRCWLRRYPFKQATDAGYIGRLDNPLRYH